MAGEIELYFPDDSQGQGNGDEFPGGSGQDSDGITGTQAYDDDIFNGAFDNNAPPVLPPGDLSISVEEPLAFPAPDPTGQVAAIPPPAGYRLPDTSLYDYETDEVPALRSGSSSLRDPGLFGKPVWDDPAEDLPHSTELAIYDPSEQLRGGFLRRTIEGFRLRREALRAEQVAYSRASQASQLELQSLAERNNQMKRQIDVLYSSRIGEEARNFAAGLSVVNPIEKGYTKLPKFAQLEQIAQQRLLASLPAPSLDTDLPVVTEGISFVDTLALRVETLLGTTWLEQNKRVDSDPGLKEGAIEYHQVRERVLGTAMDLTKQELEARRHQVLGEMYVGPTDPVMHREAAFESLVGRVGLKVGSEFDIAEKTREFKVFTRYVPNPDDLDETGMPRYVIDPLCNGIGKVIAACDKTLEQVDPRARDKRVTGLIVGTDSDSYPIELRVQSFEEHEPCVDDMTPEGVEFHLKNPVIIAGAVIEPRHIDSKITPLMLDAIINRHSVLGGQLVVDPTSWTQALIEANRRVVHPHYEQKTDKTIELQRKATSEVAGGLERYRMMTFGGGLVAPADVIPDNLSAFNKAMLDLNTASIAGEKVSEPKMVTEDSKLPDQDHSISFS